MVPARVTGCYVPGLAHTGTFPHRVKIATGWNRYAGVY